jgi:hypothetical protein
MHREEPSKLVFQCLSGKPVPLLTVIRDLNVLEEAMKITKRQFCP